MPSNDKPIGTRVGRYLNKLAKLGDDEAAALKSAPEDIKAKFAKKRGKLKQDAGTDVLKTLGIDISKDLDVAAFNGDDITPPKDSK